MTQLDFEAAPPLARRAPQTVFFARATGLLIIAAAATAAITAIWGIFYHSGINYPNWASAVFASAGLALGLIALAAIAPNRFSRSVFLLVLALLFIDIVWDTNALKVVAFPFIANFPAYFPINSIWDMPNSLIKAQVLMDFYGIPILAGVALIAAGFVFRSKNTLQQWKHIPLMIGEWLIISVIASTWFLDQALQISRSLQIQPSLQILFIALFLLTLPELILLVLLGVGLLQAA